MAGRDLLNALERTAIANLEPGVIEAVRKGSVIGVRDAINALEDGHHKNVGWTIMAMSLTWSQRNPRKESDHDLYNLRSYLALWFGTILCDKPVYVFDVNGAVVSNPFTGKRFSKYIVQATTLCITAGKLSSIRAHVWTSDIELLPIEMKRIRLYKERRKAGRAIFEKYCSDVARSVGCGEQAENARDGISIFVASAFMDLFSEDETFTIEHKCREDACFAGLQYMRRKVLELKGVPADCTEIVMDFVYKCPWKLSWRHHLQHAEKITNGKFPDIIEGNDE